MELEYLGLKPGISSPGLTGLMTWGMSLNLARAQFLYMKNGDSHRNH